MATFGIPLTFEVEADTREEAITVAAQGAYGMNQLLAASKAVREARVEET